MWKIQKIDRVFQKMGNQAENRKNSVKIERLGIFANGITSVIPNFQHVFMPP